MDPIAYLTELQDEARRQGQNKGIREGSFNYTINAWVHDKSEIARALRELAERG